MLIHNPRHQNSKHLFGSSCTLVRDDHRKDVGNIIILRRNITITGIAITKAICA